MSLDGSKVASSIPGGHIFFLVVPYSTKGRRELHSMKEGDEDRSSGAAMDGGGAQRPV